MRKIIPTGILLMLVTLVSAQEAYRSTSNPYYWKNRKPFEGYWQQDVHYNIKAVLDDQTDIIDGEEELTYFNNSPDTLNFVYFHLYQNAFIKGSYLEALNKANHFDQKFGKYEAAGKGTEVISVKIEGAEMKRTIDYSIMKVEVDKPILPGGQNTFKIRFRTYFDDGGNQRRRMKMFKDKWGNKQYDGVHWYPRICVYDRKFGWETDQHLGKEFYGDFGSFEVELSFPNNYILDATGELQNKEEVLPFYLRARLDVKNFKEKPLDSPPSEIIKADGTKRTWRFKAINVHDFAWVADPTFRIGEEFIKLPNGDRVTCVSLSQEPHSAKWQDAASFTAKVIQTYSKDIGMYAYPKMIVADARDGMEYPMLTLDGGLSPGYYGLLAHEVGHNWFFGMVGNNETYRASLDEGFTQFLTNWSMTSILGEVKPSKSNPNPMSRMDQTVYYGYIRDAISDNDMPLNTHSDDFNGALNHGGGYGNVYYKTATMLYNLQYVLGDELFIASMQHYFNQWKFCHPYFEDFRNSMIQFTHVDLNWFFDEWMETTKKINYTIERTRTKKDTLEISFHRYGQMQMPIDFSVYTKDGKKWDYLIPNTYFSKKTDATILPVWKGWGNLNPLYIARVPLHGGKMKEVVIDTTYRLADIHQTDNSTSAKRTIYFSFDKLRNMPPDRKHYLMQWRPDIWYNSVDGIKAGVHLEGNFMNRRDIFSASAWYNTLAGKDYSGSARNYVDFNFSLRDYVSKDFFVNWDFRSLDGLTLFKFGVGGQAGRDVRWEIYFKGLYRKNLGDLDYLLYNNLWVENKRNSSFNIDISKAYNYRNGSGIYKYAIRIAASPQDYSYSRLYAEWINHHRMMKLELHSRVYFHEMSGSNIAPESQLYLAGANPEDMMENKFIRSRGFVPSGWLGYGTDYNHFQAGGGLNIRGYAGYLVPRETENTQVYVFSGNNGMALNLELDVDGLIPFTPSRLAPYFHLDAYLFGDMGYIETILNPGGTYNLVQKERVYSGVMSSAGTGFAFTIKKWGRFDKPKPLTLRLDLPLFLSNTPYADGNYIKFRWVVGVNRCF